MNKLLRDFLGIGHMSRAGAIFVIGMIVFIILVLSGLISPIVLESNLAQ